MARIEKAVFFLLMEKFPEHLRVFPFSYHPLLMKDFAFKTEDLLGNNKITIMIERPTVQ